ncbi:MULTISPECIES: PAS domain S-box protein [unclassified Leptolyngbya]|uniref:PAS domain S-box protein n=1 Tax=unclassified Leptolyngbya TaxID=2650499 RepID=UPI001684E379|nr:MULTISPECIES: PAS domain S-box protein [unclassified Leptolyngbya]MBD1914097.1 PAS domain S-box protein [Leptolyngbya sp. FACHB-8]MBD2157306.1 PAS domain S-box protein [Leptolyngbya sp. FACHB-16]
MTDNLRHSISSNNGSSQDISQTANLPLEIQALQILDSSDDCIKVLDLEGRILFMNRGGQALLGIQDITPFLNTSWVKFWQEGEQQAAREAIARAGAGEVRSVQGYCLTLNGEPKWWDNKISPIRGADGKVERLLCISRDITERRQIEDQRKQAEEQSRDLEERYQAIINQAVAGVACADLDGKLILVNQKYCNITGYSADELRQLRIHDITHPEDLPRNVELFHRMRTEGTPFEIEKRYIRKDGSVVWVNNSVSVIRGRNGKPQSAVAIVLDITERKQAEASLRASEEQFRLFTAASSDTVYKMSADWREMRLLNGKDFLASTQLPSQIWFEKYIPLEEQPRVMAAIAEAIRTKSTFELEHRIIQLNGTIGWTFSRAIPLLNDQNEVVEWLGAASDVTARKQAELSAELLATVTQNLAEAACVEDIIQTVGEQFNHYLQVSNCAFVEINERAKVATIDYCWHQEDVPSLVGIYRLPEFVTGEFLQTAKLGQTIIVRDVETDPHIGDPEQFAALKIGSFINVPLIREGEWKFTLGIYHQTPYNWRSNEIDLMRELANRIWTKLERTRVETALRESEAKYRSLFESIDAGFCLIEVLFDDTGKAFDYRFLEVNSAFEKQTELVDVIGKTIRELIPEIENHRSELYGRIVLTGVSERFQNVVQEAGQFYDVYAFRIGEPQERKVAILFNDISDRKRREANLAFLADITEDFSRLSSANEIMQTVGAKIGAYLQITTCNFADVDKAHDQVTAHYGWSSSDVPSTRGTFRISQYLSKEFERASRAGEMVVICNTQIDPRTDAAGYAALNIHSFVTVPFHHNDTWTHYIAICDSKPRDWREDEIQLIEEISNRIFPRLERARIEEALWASEAKYRSLFESIDEGFCLIEVLFDETGKAFDYRFLEVNPAFEKQTGLVDAIGKTVRELVPQLEEHWFELYGRIALTGVPERFENAAQQLGRFYDVYGFRMGEPQERKVAVLFNDISDRKQTEIALRESEERFRLMGDAVPQIVWITNSEGRVEFFNKQWSNYTGVPYEPTTAAEIAANFVHPDDGAMTMEAFNQAREMGSIFTVEHRIRAADGTYRWFLVKAEPYRHPETGEIIRWFGASVDIHDRKQAEAAIAADLRDTQLLRDLSARMTTETDIQVLYDKILATAIALTQADAGSFQFFNQATQELLLLATQGISPKVGEKFNRLSTRCHTSCGIALATGERAFVDFDVPASEDPDGSKRLHFEAGLLSAQSTPLMSRSGQPIGMVSTHWRTRHRPSDRELRFLDLLARQAADLIEQRQDAAQRKQLLEREQAAREAAERANRIKDEFLAILSHELRSPLNPILGWSKLLQSRKLDEAKTAQALATIERNAKLQSELIEDLLDVSRILRGKLSLNVARVNLASTIRAAMETVRLAAEAKSIQIEASLVEDADLILGDSTRLQQVVWNLLSNAVKFTSPGGQVSIRLDRLDSSAQIIVSDTGQGIAPSFLPYVFDYFRQEDGTTTRKFGGLGLGLAIVRHLVELHGGTVSVESPGEGQGATFTVRLPLLSPSSNTNQDERSPDPSLDLRGTKILVVDDESDTRELVAFVLEQQGAQVTAATSAQEALSILPQAKPDVLLSDIGMPEMDGYMLIQQVRALAPEQGGQIPAIALTAYAGDTNRQQVIAAGFQKHISKPIEPEVLVQAITGLVGNN